MYAKCNTVKRNDCCNRNRAMCSLCTAELQVTVNSQVILRVPQKCFHDKFMIHVASTNKAYLVLHMMSPTFLSDSKQIWSFLTDFIQAANITLRGNPSSGHNTDICRWTGRQPGRPSHNAHFTTMWMHLKTHFLTHTSHILRQHTRAFKQRCFEIRWW